MVIPDPRARRLEAYNYVYLFLHFCSSGQSVNPARSRTIDGYYPSMVNNLIVACVLFFLAVFALQSIFAMFCSINGPAFRHKNNNNISSFDQVLVRHAVRAAALGRALIRARKT